MKKHIIWMIIGCGLPLLLIFFAPAFGINGNISLFIFVIFMFACHLLMPMHHHAHLPDGQRGHKHGSSDENHSETSKTKTHESHQH